MLTFIELLIGVVVIVGVARYIIKGYSATGVLFVGGLLLLIISAGNDSNLLIVFYVQIMPDDFVMQLHRF